MTASPGVAVILVPVSVFAGLSACHRCSEAPVWGDLPTVHLGAGAVTLDLADLAVDDKDGLEFLAQDDPDVLTELDGTRLTLTPQPDWIGETTIVLTAVDRCDNKTTAVLAIDSALPTTGTSAPGSCPVTFTWTSAGAPDRVTVSGSFDDWDPEGHALTADGATWTATVPLAPGAYAYKFVEWTDGAFEPTQAWACDPTAAEMVCDPGTAPAGQPFTQDCTPGANSCNSLLVVPDCAVPTVSLASLAVDRAAGRVSASFSSGSLAGDEVLAVTLDGERVDAPGGEVDARGLAPGRHELRATATDGSGRTGDAVVPFWTDDFDWDRAVLYFAFVDRLANGDARNDDPTGATGAEWHGGDWAGLRGMLPYLDDLGVTVLWISNPQEAAAGAWDGDCGLTYAGYHMYWPADPLACEPRFGDEDELAALVDAAHDRGIRVVMDWVGNHVHEDHPYYAEHPEWFHGYEDCKATVNGQMNFDRIPEECWFAPYLPDVDYSNPAALDAMLGDAVHWVDAYGLDGLRVDAVKHMSHGVVHDLRARLEGRFEHHAQGGDEDLWTVGETFDGADRIAAYLGEDGLDGQFDFPLYWSVRSVFGYGQGQVMDLLAAWDGSKAAFGDARMSTFLGNHDVNRFVTDAFEGSQAVCDGSTLRTAQPPPAAWPYESLRLGFTFLFTMPGVPLVYYGDELGIPGHGDPDNRQPLDWHVSGLDAVRSVDDLQGRVDPEELRTARHVRALAHARARHPALSQGGWIEWWREADVGAYAREAAGDHALVILNRSGADRTLDNGLAFAGLPPGTYEDVLTGDTFTSTGDRISIFVPARGSRVLVPR